MSQIFEWQSRLHVGVYFPRHEMRASLQTETPYWSGKISTINLPVLFCSDQLLYLLKIYYSFFYKTSYLNMEVHRT